jgi:hypothetical protein
MTWSARITRPDGTNPTKPGVLAPDYFACQSCQHIEACQVAKIAHNVASILTSVDVGCDGHTASGEALLKCYGYEAKE